MHKPRLSVALCTHNGARFLSEQLESIAAQTLLPDEVIVCDDRSTDETVEIVKSFANQTSIAVRLQVNAERLGSTKNFEKAIGMCQGETIALADQDDVWKAPKLAVLQKTLEDHPEDGYVFSDAELIDENGASLGKNLWESLGFRGSARNDFSSRRQVPTLLHRASATGATMAFRSYLKSILLPLPSYFVHDYWISLLASCVGVNGVPVPQTLIQYRQHPGQQIGALRVSILQKVRWARQVEHSEYSLRTQAFLDLRERLLLAATQGWTYPANHVALIEEKIRHCSQRASAHSSHGTGKVKKVLSEVMTGRYARFSNSWRSVVEDLCF
jgi:glycosyltransferase involved in cell wall biosynthesis